MPEKKLEFIVVPDPHNVPITFVNQVVAAGHVAGVVNISFAVARFTPNSEGQVDADLAMACNLRMDLGCLEQVYQQAGRILQQAHAQAQVLASTIVTSSATPGRSGKGN